MTEQELNVYISIKNRIDEVEEELYALFEAQEKVINPIKKIIHTISKTKRKDYQHQCTIKLTKADIRSLQDNRLIELDALRRCIPESEGAE